MWDLNDTMGSILVQLVIQWFQEQQFQASTSKIRCRPGESGASAPILRLPYLNDTHKNCWESKHKKCFPGKDQTLMLECCMEPTQEEDAGVKRGETERHGQGREGKWTRWGQNGGIENTPGLLNMTGDTTLITWFTEHPTVRPQSWSAWVSQGPVHSPPIHIHIYCLLCLSRYGCKSSVCMF